MNEHCWHEDGTILTSYPMQMPVTCCWCGLQAIRKWVYVPTPGHGDKLKHPATRLEQEPLPVGGCVER